MEINTEDICRVIDSMYKNNIQLPRPILIPSDVFISIEAYISFVITIGIIIDDDKYKYSNGTIFGKVCLCILKIDNDNGELFIIEILDKSIKFKKNSVKGLNISKTIDNLNNTLNSFILETHYINNISKIKKILNNYFVEKLQYNKQELELLANKIQRSKAETNKNDYFNLVGENPPQKEMGIKHKDKRITEYRKTRETLQYHINGHRKAKVEVPQIYKKKDGVYYLEIIDEKGNVITIDDIGNKDGTFNLKCPYCDNNYRCGGTYTIH
jgi:hypothetical protein